MKYDNPNQLGQKGSEVAIPPGSDDWLSRANALVTNFRELLKMAKEIKGMGGMEAPGEGSNILGGPNPGSGIGQGTILKFLDLVIAQGHGETTIGKVIENLSPFTINQLKEVIKRVGPGK